MSSPANFSGSFRAFVSFTLFWGLLAAAGYLHGQIGAGWHAAPAISPAQLAEGAGPPEQSDLEEAAPEGMQMLLIEAPVHPEIEELAEALGHDPLTIFNWVRNKIDYRHYRGAKKGALTTLVERSGNDYDQSLLLRDLLRASGIDSQFAIGFTAIPYQHADGMDVRHWLGMPVADGTNLHAQYLLVSRGTIPDGPADELFWNDDNINLQRAWVSATIGGQPRLLDPSFKKYEQVVGIDLTAATSYAQSSALAQLAGTVADGNRSITGASDVNFGAYLTDRTTALLQTLSQPAHALKYPIEIMGGWRLTEWEASDLSEAFPLDLTFGPGSYNTFDEFPADRIATLTLRLGSNPQNGQTSLSLTKPLPELDGQRLTLEFAKNGATTKAQIWLDDVLWGEEPAFVAGTSINLEIEIDHPTNGNFPYQKFQQTYQRTVTVNGMPNGTPIYALSYGYDVSPESLRQRERKLEDYRAAGKADNSREVMGETLNIIGQHWYLQTQLVGGIVANLTGCAQQYHHRIGRVAQTEGVYIDVFGHTEGNFSRTANEVDRDTDFKASGFYWSAMEHGVLAQLQQNLPAASTVGLISRATALGHKVFVLNSPDDYTVIASQLVDYPTVPDDLKAHIQARLQVGGTVVVPMNGNLRMNEWPSPDLWHGAGYVHSASSPLHLGMIISGGFNGGFSTNNWTTSASMVADLNRTSSGTITLQPPSTSVVASIDPVDLSNGSFFTEEHVDLSVGSTLALSRSYHTSRRNDDSRGMGYGWTHSGHLRLSERTNVENGLGLRSAADMAATLASAVAVLDLYRTRNAGNDYQKKWLGALFAAHWAVNLLKNNSVSVQLPDKHLEFTRQPGGSYTPPPGVQATLIKVFDFYEGVYYTITPRHGGTTTFVGSAGSYRIKQTTDLWNRVQTYSYDGAGKLTQITDPFGRSLSFAYTNGRISSVSDSTGRSVSYTYDANGNLTTFTDPEGKTDQFFYDALHRIFEIKDGTGRSVVKNFYDERSRVFEQHNQGLPDRPYTFAYSHGQTRETDPAGGVTLHLFDDRGRGVGRVDALGRRWRVGYDARDHVVSETTPLGRTTTAAYDRFDNLLTTTDATGATTTYVYDAAHRLTSVTDPLNRTTSYTHNAKHQVLTATNALNETTTNVYNGGTGYLTSTSNHVGHTTTFEYDTFGQLTKTTLPGNVVVEQSVSARGDVQWSKDARGVQTNYTYNLRREPLTATSGGRTTRTEYDNNRMPWRSVNARGFASTTTYSPTGKPLVATGPDGATIITAYDTRDNPVETTGPLGETVETLRDLLNRPATTLDPLGHSVTSEFDEDGAAVEVQAPLGRTIATDYQIAPGQPRLVTSTDALNRITISEYDAAGQHRFLINRKGEAYEMLYDSPGRLVQTIQPGGRTIGTGYAWNGTGLLQTLTEPSGQSTALQFDALGRLVTRTGPDSTTSYAYDPNGNLLTATEGTSVLTRTYEADRNLVSTYTNADGETIAYAYDANGNLLTLTYPGGKQVNYAYDSNDRLLRMTDWAGRVTKFEYDASGGMTAIKRSNGTIRRMTFDLAGQMTSFVETNASGVMIASQSWHYDAGGRPTQRLRVPGATAFATPAFAATYHADNRLATLTPQGGSSTTVISDDDGNVMSVPLWEPTQSWNTATLAWDSRNRLVSATTGAIGVTYNYDAEGNLLTRTQNSQTTRYTVNPNAALSQVLITHRPDGGKTFHVYGAGLLYEESFDAGGASLGTRSYHYDQVGSTVALSNDAGAVTGRLEYTAYGLTSHTSGSVDTPFRYNGRFGVMTDTGTGMLSMRARWYSPGVGRFLSEDPIGFSGGMNWYAYADGNPVSLLDPFGLAASRETFSQSLGRRALGMGMMAFAMMGGGDMVNRYNRFHSYNNSAFDGVMGAVNPMADPVMSFTAMWSGTSLNEATFGENLSMGGRVWEGTKATGQTVLAGAMIYGLRAPAAARTAAFNPADFADDVARIRAESAARHGLDFPGAERAVMMADDFWQKGNRVVSLDRLRPPPTKPFADPEKLLRHGTFDPAQYTPIIVDELSDGTLVIMEGMTRVENARRAGMTQLPAFVYPRR